MRTKDNRFRYDRSALRYPSDLTDAAVFFRSGQVDMNCRLFIRKS